jgi:hypothetical protein
LFSGGSSYRLTVFYVFHVAEPPGPDSTFQSLNTSRGQAVPENSSAALLRPDSVVGEVLVAEQSSLPFWALGFEELPTVHHVAAKLPNINTYAAAGGRIVTSR